MSDHQYFETQSGSIKFYLYIKRIFYHLSKSIGLFALASIMSRRALRIICYHGISLYDESSFSPRTFISPDKFRKRIAYLKKKKYVILDLDSALDMLDNNALPSRAVVITIDDGFYSTYSSAFPILKNESVKATVYVTTYYSVMKNPVFNLVIPYMFWKTERASISIEGLDLPYSGVLSIRNRADKERLVSSILSYGQDQCNEEERFLLAKRIGKRLGVDYISMVESRILSIMNEKEIQELSDSGYDIELHTHRHRFPNIKEEAVREIFDNKAVLEPIVGRRLRHFCYPSGIWTENQWPWLSEMEIRSSVTTDLGINYHGTPRYALKRFGDDELLSTIEFEAEICGYAYWIRKIKSVID